MYPDLGPQLVSVPNPAIDPDSKPQSGRIGAEDDCGALVDELKAVYRTYHLEWVEHCEAMDRLRQRLSRKKRPTLTPATAVVDISNAGSIIDLNNPLNPSSANPGLTTITANGRTTRRTANSTSFGVGDAVTDAQFDIVLAHLGTADQKDPNIRAMKTTAVVPDMALLPEERKSLLMNAQDDTLVDDPIKFYELDLTQDEGSLRSDPHQSWTKEEQEAFEASYTTQPKQFGWIASQVGTKTRAECVLHYYRTKRESKYRNLHYYPPPAVEGKPREVRGKRTRKTAIKPQNVPGTNAQPKPARTRLTLDPGADPQSDGEGDDESIAPTPIEPAPPGILEANPAGTAQPRQKDDPGRPKRPDLALEVDRLNPQSESPDTGLEISSRSDLEPKHLSSAKISSPPKTTPMSPRRTAEETVETLSQESNSQVSFARPADPVNRVEPPSFDHARVPQSNLENISLSVQNATSDLQLPPQRTDDVRPDSNVPQKRKHDLTVESNVSARAKKPISNPETQQPVMRPEAAFRSASTSQRLAEPVLVNPETKISVSSSEIRPRLGENENQRRSQPIQMRDSAEENPRAEFSAKKKRKKDKMISDLNRASAPVVVEAEKGVKETTASIPWTPRNENPPKPPTSHSSMQIRNLLNDDPVEPSVSLSNMDADAWFGSDNDSKSPTVAIKPHRAYHSTRPRSPQQPVAPVNQEVQAASGEYRPRSVSYHQPPEKPRAIKPASQTRPRLPSEAGTAYQKVRGSDPTVVEERFVDPPSPARPPKEPQRYHYAPRPHLETVMTTDQGNYLQSSSPAPRAALPPYLKPSRNYAPSESPIPTDYYGSQQKVGSSSQQVASQLPPNRFHSQSPRLPSINAPSSSAASQHHHSNLPRPSRLAPLMNTQPKQHQYQQQQQQEQQHHQHQQEQRHQQELQHQQHQQEQRHQQHQHINESVVYHGSSPWQPPINHPNASYPYATGNGNGHSNHGWIESQQRSKFDNHHHIGPESHANLERGGVEGAGGRRLINNPNPNSSSREMIIEGSNEIKNGHQVGSARGYSRKSEVYQNR